MNLDFDIRTAYFFLGILALGGALGMHVSLRQLARRRHQTWVWGGVCFGAGLMMIAFRGWVPEFVTFELSHLFLVASCLLQISALGAEVGRGWSMARMAMVLALTGSVYTVLTSLDRGWGLMFNSVTVLVGALFIALSALRIWREDRRLPALVIATGYGLLLASVIARLLSLLQTTLGRGGPFEQGGTQTTLMMGGLVAIILGHLGYLGLQFQRMAAEQVEAERAAAMEAERARQVRERAEALHELLEERNQLIQRIARSEAASDLALFATSLPHELSQPLCAVKLNIDCLKQGLRQAGEPGLLSVVQAIETSNERVLDLLDQLRILLQIQEYSGGETVDLRALVLRTLPILEGSFAEHRIQLVPSLPEGRFEVQASATQLQQLLLILCAHALDDLRRQPPPSGAKQQVRVSLQGDDREIRLRVEDSGPRSGTDLRSRLALGAGVAPASPGREDRLGVGYTVAQRVAQAHQGQLDIEDSALGGTAFVLTLPTPEMLQQADQAWPSAPGETAALQVSLLPAAPQATG